MSGLNDLTACVTTFRRPDRLARCIESIRAAGLTNIVVQDGGKFGGDVGCNATWMLAAYRAKTKRILLIHDDDLLKPDFGEAYEKIVAPCLDCRDAGFASWRAELRYDDGRTEPCEYWQGPSAVSPSRELSKVVDAEHRLSLSPILSVFNRHILIRACKEAGETLRLNGSLERPGMLLGTEILVYMRHIEHFKRWLYVDHILAQYGSHEGSGTIRAQRERKEQILTLGYDLARRQGRRETPEPTPRIILVHSVYEQTDAAARERQRIAQESWKWHFSNATVINCPHESPTLPTLTELLDHGCVHALPEDVVVYANADCGLTSPAPERILRGIERGRGVTCCGNRNLHPEPGRLYHSVGNCKAPGGIDVVAVTPAWWESHRQKMPKMYIGREAWDAVFATLAEEWADGKALSEIAFSDLWPRSKAHTDDVCWHEEHDAPWMRDRTGSETQRHNRDVARQFFSLRGNRKALEWLK